MAKSKKNVNVNLATISIEATEILSRYNVAEFALEALRKAHKVTIDRLEEKKAEVMAEAEEVAKKHANGKLTQEEEIVYSGKLLDISRKIMAEDEAYKEAQKPYRAAIRTAVNQFVPENIYAAYVEAWTFGRDTNFTDCIRKFLAAVGIAVRSDGELVNFTITMKTRIAGSRKNSSDDREQTGMRKRCKAERSFKTDFVDSFLDYAIVGKKVLILNEDNTVEKRIFEEA